MHGFHLFFRHRINYDNLHSAAIITHNPFAVRIFPAPMLTDQNVHTARGCGPAVHSRSGAAAAVQLSLPHRVYFCCAACA